MALSGPQAATHSRHSEQTPHCRQRLASAWTCCRVKPSATSWKDCTRSAAWRSGMAVRRCCGRSSGIWRKSRSAGRDTGDSTRSPDRSAWMVAAARRPAAMARTTEEGPETVSPAA